MTKPCPIPCWSVARARTFCFSCVWLLCRSRVHLASAYSNGSFPQLRVPMLGVPITRTIAFWGLCWGPPIQGNYQVASCRSFILGLVRAPSYTQTPTHNRPYRGHNSKKCTVLFGAEQSRLGLWALGRSNPQAHHFREKSCQVSRLDSGFLCRVYASNTTA